MNQQAVARNVVDVLREVWRDWSQVPRRFDRERRSMHPAFIDQLQVRLPTPYLVKRNSRPPSLPRHLSSWSLYDVMVLHGDLPIALVELSLGDTNVPHALHNGELKLLGNCEGRSVETGMPFHIARGLSAADVAAVASTLGAIPVRGLFFPTDQGAGILDRREAAVWHETREGVPRDRTHFYSAILAPQVESTLRDTFSAFA